MNTVQKAASILGRIGGKRGIGAAKVRDFATCHKAAIARWGNRTIQERFEQKFEKGSPEECWNWKAATFNGYGRFSAEGRSVLASRFAFELYVRPLNPKEHVLHRCDNPSCVNPKHLFAGNHTDNMRDCAAKNRFNHAKGERNVFAKLTEVQVREIRQRYKPLKNTQKLPKGVMLPGSHRALAKEYGISPSVIRQVVSRKIWKHI